MILESIRIIDFRNIEGASVALDPSFNLIVGQNAQGKTNFLEAAVCLSDGRSFRGGRIQEMIRKGLNAAVVDGSVISNSTRSRLQVRMEKTGRGYLMNGKTVSDLKDYLGKIIFVVFSADHIRMLAGAPQERRDFLDKGLFTLKPLTALRMKSYRKALKERNILLAAPDPDRNLIDSFSQQLAANGAHIAAARRNFLKSIMPIVSGFHRQITGQSEEICIEYVSQYAPDDDPEDVIRMRLMQKYMEQIDPELDQKTTLYGPHRDDMRISINGADVRSFASRGQRRTLLLSIKLAEMELILRTRQEHPILVLDDVAAELDENRRQALLDLVPRQAQVLISLTDRDACWTGKLSNKLFHVQSGVIQPDNDGS